MNERAQAIPSSIEVVASSAMHLRALRHGRQASGRLRGVGRCAGGVCFGRGCSRERAVTEPLQKLSPDLSAPKVF